MWLRAALEWRTIQELTGEDVLGAFLLGHQILCLDRISLDHGSPPSLLVPKIRSLENPVVLSKGVSDGS